MRILTLTFISLEWEVCLKHGKGKFFFSEKLKNFPVRFERGFFEQTEKKIILSSPSLSRILKGFTLLVKCLDTYKELLICQLFIWFPLKRVCQNIYPRETHHLFGRAQDPDFLLFRIQILFKLRKNQI